MEQNVKCTKPHCDCLEREERRTGGPVKMYPCLANAGQKNSLGDLKSIEERGKAFCQPDVLRLREVLAQLHTEEFNAFSHATDDFTASKHASNMKAIYFVMQLISERHPVA